MSAVETPRAPHRFSRLDVRSLDPPPRLILNPRAGQKLGLPTNAGGAEVVEAALAAAGLRVVLSLTEAPQHATQLAREAADEGCQLVIAAGGDGTLGEAAKGLVGSQTALGIMPLGSIMNIPRMLGVPRDLNAAAQIIAAGQVLAMDVGRVFGRECFLEAGGVGLAAGLFGYFDRLDSGAPPQGVLRGALRFMRGLGTPRLVIVADGRRFEVRSPMVTVANGPFVGAAYALAPEARVDDGVLDVLIFREAGVLRVLLHMLLVAGGRRRPAPPRTQVLQARRIEVATRSRRRPLPVHADGAAVGATPAVFEVLTAALRVIVGEQGAFGYASG